MYRQQIAGLDARNLAVAVDCDVNTEIDAARHRDPTNGVVNRIANRHAPPRIGVTNHLCIMQPHGGVETGETRRHHLWTTTESCKEVRFDKASCDLDVGLGPAAVEPDWYRRFDVWELGEFAPVKGIMVDHRNLCQNVRTDHVLQLRDRGRPVGPSSDKNHDVVGPDVRQLFEYDG